MKLRTNISSLNATRYARIQSGDLESSQRKLSSGKRITQASDDAASLSISSQVEAHLASNRQANRNANDAISIIQVAEGTLSTMQTLVTRVRELAVQASSDTVSDTERGYIDLEREQLMSEMNRMTHTTRFNGHQLLDGSEDELSIVVGIHNKKSDQININLSNLAQDSHSLGLYQLDLKTARHARHSLSRLDFALNSISESRAELGAFQSRLQTSSNNLQTSHQSMSAANSQLSDADYALETAKQVSSKIKLEMATNAIKIANVSQASALKLLE